ncbi:hypothetical protein C8R45DRAFT_1131705 [Mycena sanguinolenta]|nr:hypothetical protein C8R45DRAFT_1131705 [Mycena sanguinolenta]
MAEVYVTFSDGHGSTYLFMEHVDAVSFRAWIEGSTDEQEREKRTATAVAAITEAVEVLPSGRGWRRQDRACRRRIHVHCFHCMDQAPSRLSTPPPWRNTSTRRCAIYPGAPRSASLSQTSRIATALSFPVSSKLALPGAAAVMTMQTGNSSFGTTHDGNSPPVPPARRIRIPL